MKFSQGLFVFICMFVLLPWVSEAQQVQKVQDVSGLWTMQFKGVEANCQDENENGPKEGQFVFEVEQKGDTLAATWKDGKTTNVLTGKVSGTIVNATVYGFYPENCRVLTYITAEIIGAGGLVGRYSGQELNCETCTWEGEITVTIAK